MPDTWLFSEAEDSNPSLRPWVTFHNILGGKPDYKAKYSFETRMLFTLKPEISFQLYELVRHSRYNASLLQRWVNKADYGNVYYENCAWLLHIHTLGITQGFSVFKWSQTDCPNKSTWALGPFCGVERNSLCLHCRSALVTCRLISFLSWYSYLLAANALFTIKCLFRREWN